jgi:NAD(P)-dependent dehydrogenase (short-subunit alcohol dehydrogenase family)
MLLENKSAVIYGGAGSIGGAVADAFAREGAKVFLAAARGPGSRRSQRRSAQREGRPRPRRSTHSTSRQSTGTPTRSRRRPMGSTSPST